MWRRITGPRLAIAVGVAAVTLAAVLQMRGSASVASAPVVDDSSGEKSCCIAPPRSRLEALTSKAPQRPAAEKTAPRD